MLTRAATLIGFFALAGCATVVPLQTATTVPKGATRVAGQMNVVPWCGVALNPVEHCGRLPRAVPSPELRGNVRHGVGARTDVGASVRAGTVGSHAELGFYLDAKMEVWSSEPVRGRRQLVSIAPGAGFGGALLRGHGSPIQAGLPVVDFALPVFLGHETESVEWVLGPRFLHRLHLDDGRITSIPAIGATAGLFTRQRTRFGIQLGYETPLFMPRWGTWSLSAGGSYDFGL